MGLKNKILSLAPKYLHLLASTYFQIILDLPSLLHLLSRASRFCSLSCLRVLISPLLFFLTATLYSYSCLNVISLRKPELEFSFKQFSGTCSSLYNPHYTFNCLYHLWFSSFLNSMWSNNWSWISKAKTVPNRHSTQYRPINEYAYIYIHIKILNTHTVICKFYIQRFNKKYFIFW